MPDDPTLKVLEAIRDNTDQTKQILQELLDKTEIKRVQEATPEGPSVAETSAVIDAERPVPFNAAAAAALYSGRAPISASTNIDRMINQASVDKARTQRIQDTATLPQLQRTQEMPAVQYEGPIGPQRPAPTNGMVAAPIDTTGGTIVNNTNGTGGGNRAAAIAGAIFGSRAGNLTKALGGGALGFAAGATLGGGISAAYGGIRDLYNVNQAQNPVRASGYALGGGGVAAGGNLSLGQQYANSIFGNQYANALGITDAYTAFANSGLNQFLGQLGLGVPNISASQMLGGQVYATALKDALGNQGQGWTIPVAYAAVQEGIKRGYTAGTSGKWQNSLFGQFYQASKEVTTGTYGLLDPSVYSPLLDLMFRKFGQSFDTTAKTILGFNTAAASAKKGLQDYTDEITTAIQNMQQQGLVNGTQAITAAQTYSSIPQLSGNAVQQITAAAAPYMLAYRTLPNVTQSDLISIATGNVNAMASQDPNQIPLSAINAAQDMVNNFMKSGMNRQAAIQMAAMLLHTSAGDLTSLLDPNNVKAMTRQANLGMLTDQLMPQWGSKRGAGAATQFSKYMADYNSTYGLNANAAKKLETPILAKLKSGKETFAQAVADLQKAGNQPSTQATPMLATIQIQAGKNTSITNVSPGSNYGNTATSPRAGVVNVGLPASLVNSLASSMGISPASLLGG